MTPISQLLSLIVGLAFAARGAGALFGSVRARRRADALRLGRPARWTLGALELLGGVAMLLAIAQPFLVFFAGAMLVVLSVATLSLHAVRGAMAGTRTAAGLLAATVIAAALQPLGLRVLLLPKAESLPRMPVSSAHLIKTFGEGVWLESVKAAPDGTLYLTANQGEDYATGDKSRVQARVLARAPDGHERVVFELPKGATAGVICIAADGTLYLTGQGARLGVWRLTPEGRGELFAELPSGAWPNGIAEGPDHQLYVADSALGVIWRVDPATGAVSRAIDSKLLQRRRYVALAPGANGVHFFGRDLYVTVSDAARIVRFELRADGHFGAPSVFAEGIPGDDFAIDGHGALYVTTHPFNTIVRISQDGQRTIIADAGHGIVGATDAVFGTGADHRDTLYVATDGGAFSGDAKARGTLVALTVDAADGRSNPGPARAP